MIVGGYDLHLYCEGMHTPLEYYELMKDHQFFGETRRQATAEARRAGWIVNHRTGEAWCPTCAKRPRQKRTSSPIGAPEHG